MHEQLVQSNSSKQGSAYQIVEDPCMNSAIFENLMTAFWCDPCILQALHTFIHNSIMLTPIHLVLVSNESPH